MLRGIYQEQRVNESTLVTIVGSSDEYQALLRAADIPGDLPLADHWQRMVSYAKGASVL